MLHTRHTNAFHAAAPRVEIWLQVAAALAFFMADRLTRALRRS